MTSWDYSFVHKSKLFHGKLALEQIPIELEQKSARNPLLITQGNTPRSTIKSVVKTFSRFLDKINIYDRAPSWAEEDSIREIADIYHETGADSILALGGHSVIETGKGANILVCKHDANFRELQGRDTLSGTMRPLYAIPTHVQSGAGVNMSLRINSGNESYFLSSPLLMPTGVVTDPRTMIASSKQETAKSIAASLFKAVEAATGPNRNPTGKAFAYTCLALLRKELNDFLDNTNNKELQARVVNANVISDMAISNTTRGLGFAISRDLIARGNNSGDVAAGCMLPEIMKTRIKQQEYRDSMARLLLPLAGPENYASTPAVDRPEEAVKAVEGFVAGLQKAGEEEFSLQNLGIEASPEDIARTVADDQQSLGDEAVTEQQLVHILNSVH
ncbi:MAG: iron-containing alcohol dehydrogenase [Thermodesulfobacteriota bacterium]